MQGEESEERVAIWGVIAAQGGEEDEKATQDMRQEKEDEQTEGSVPAPCGHNSRKIFFPFQSAFPRTRCVSHWDARGRQENMVNASYNESENKLLVQPSALRRPVTVCTNDTTQRTAISIFIIAA